MISEEIKKLLTSELENDQLLGWELVDAKKIPYVDVLAFIKETNETSKECQFYWARDRFRLNRFNYAGGIYGATATLGISSQILVGTGAGGRMQIPNYNTSVNYPKYLHNIIKDEEVQKKAWLDKSRKIWENIKAFAKRIF